MKPIRQKKSLGQHFLVNEEISAGVANSIPQGVVMDKLLEVGPGKGILTKQLLDGGYPLAVVELDDRLIEPLHQQFPGTDVHHVDFLQLDLRTVGQSVGIIGNFPYNISSQIVFKVLENRDMVPFMAGMFQQEVAARVAGPHGNKDYGVLSVLAQAYYNVEYLFGVGPENFDPPPQVDSGVIRMIRKTEEPPVVYERLRTVVKAAFATRRKTLRNCLKALIPEKEKMTGELFDRRAEQLSLQEFIELTNSIYPNDHAG